MPNGKPFMDPGDFSLILGGPLFQLLRRAHLSGNAPRMLRRRIFVLVLFAWLPLLALSALNGQMLGGQTLVPFLLDIDVQVRFLVAMPLLIVSELVVHQRMHLVPQAFLDRHLIPDGSMTRFKHAVASAMRLRNSVLAEVLLAVLVYGVGILIVWRHHLALDTTTWYATPSGGGNRLSPAGIWYGYASLPFMQFLLIRWYFRMMIWARLLWQLSRIELVLTPTHPDRLGGLGFLSNANYAFTPLAAAHGALLAGLLANRIFYVKATLPDFKLEICMVVVFMLCLVLGPLLVFVPQLSRAWRRGNGEYGTLAARYVREFHAKWIGGGSPAGEPLIGSADIQSLADLANSLEVVRSMRIVPFSMDLIMWIAIATLAPIVPLILTMMPLEAAVKLLFGIFI